MSRALPADFTQLAPYAEKWALGTESSRRKTRMQSSQAELVEFYNAMKPVLDDAIQHLNKFGLDDMPEPEQNLLNTALSLVEISVAVELFRNPWPLNAWPWDAFTVTD